jgi:Rha family phage regulatory protein
MVQGIWGPGLGQKEKPVSAVIPQIDENAERRYTMNQLVFLDGGRPVTDSLTVAEAFGKEHRRVMQDIRELACSEDFRVHHFVQSDYINGQGRQTPKYLMTEQGFALLVMGYTGPQAMEFKERYITAFDRMRQQLQPNSVEDLIIMQAQAMKDVRQRVGILEDRTNKAAEAVKAIKDTFLSRDEDWRSKMTGMIKTAGYRRGKDYQEIWNLCYQIFEERAHCRLETRLDNLRDRLKASGATKSKINAANKLDIIESEPRLKEIFTTVVKELSIGTMH